MAYPPMDGQMPPAAPQGGGGGGGLQELMQLASTISQTPQGQAIMQSLMSMAQGGGSGPPQQMAQGPAAPQQMPDEAPQSPMPQDEAEIEAIQRAIASGMTGKGRQPTGPSREAPAPRVHQGLRGRVSPELKQSNRPAREMPRGKPTKGRGYEKSDNNSDN